MSAPVPDASETMYTTTTSTTTNTSEERVPSRPRSPSPSTKSTSEEEDKEFNKRLLISLGMLLPALAAIIGVVAWAISAEVVMGAKREAARRHSESSMRLSNKFDYSKFHHPAANSLPTKEMLIDPKASEHNRENLDFFNQKMEEMGQDLMMRKMDEHKEEPSGKSAKSKVGNASVLNDKLKDKLTQENIAQLIEKLLRNHAKAPNSKNPQIVVVAPAVNHSKNASRHMIETKVTTNKPKAFNLKMAPSKEDRVSSKSTSTKTSTAQSKKRSSTPAPSSKRRPSNSNTSKASKNTNHAETSTKGTTPKPGKNYKTKIYEKEIDILLQKIEKLEKQQNIKPNQQKDAMAPIPDKVANSDLFKGSPTNIADKIKGFLSGHGPEESRPHGVEQPDQNNWQPSGMPPPPMPPPMPFMPFMPPHMPHAAYGSAPQETPAPNHPHHPYPPQNVQQYPKDGMQMEPSYHDYQHVPSHQQPMQPNYEQQQGPMQHQRPEYQQQQQQQQPDYQHQSQQQQSEQYRPNGEMSPPDMQHSHMGQMNQMAHQNQGYGPLYESPNGDGQPAAPSKKRGGLFGGKFKLSNIINSVIPKSKKAKQAQKNVSDNRNIHVNNAPIDPMMAQESHQYQNVDRGQYGEQPGFSMNFGAGPVGGGGQIKASPMGILKSIMLPLSGIPKWVNGKVVLGIVLENGIGKKPKTIFQHFSTGRIRR